VVGAPSGAITCSSATDPGTMTVPPDLLLELGVGSAGVTLVRSITANASCDNATVTIVSTTSVSGAPI
jgi:hypothetical protein